MALPAIKRASSPAPPLHAQELQRGHAPGRFRLPDPTRALENSLRPSDWPWRAERAACVITEKLRERS